MFEYEIGFLSILVALITYVVIYFISTHFAHKTKQKNQTVLAIVLLTSIVTNCIHIKITNNVYSILTFNIGYLVGITFCLFLNLHDNSKLVNTNQLENKKKNNNKFNNNKFNNKFNDKFNNKTTPISTNKTLHHMNNFIYEPYQEPHYEEFN